MDMMATVESKKPTMTALELKISEWIFQNTESVIRMPITSLAQKCGVSDATIVRFARKLGYTGYNDFKVALALEISQKNETEDTIVTGNIGKDDTVETIAKKYYDINLQSLQHTISLINYEEIEKATKLILSAKKIHFLGIGYSGITAQEAKYNYMRIGLDADAYTDGHTMIMISSIIDSGDVIFAISHSGDTLEVVNSLKAAKQNGVRIICVTSNGSSKIAAFADALITYVSTETRFQTGSIPTKIAQYFVLELINTQVIRNSIGNSAAHKKLKTIKALERLLK